MPTTSKTLDALFATEFLKHYLRNGIGSMSKSDIDALVMHLLDLHANESGLPLVDSLTKLLASDYVPLCPRSSVIAMKLA